MKTRLLTVIFCALLLGACSSGTDSPEDVVEAYLNAAMEHDTETMREMLVKEEAEFLKDLPDNWAPRRTNAKVSFTVCDATINGDNATVPVTHKIGGDSEMTTRYACIRQDGQWRVSPRGSKQADK